MKSIFLLKSGKKLLDASKNGQFEEKSTKKNVWLMYMFEKVKGLKSCKNTQYFGLLFSRKSKLRDTINHNFLIKYQG